MNDSQKLNELTKRWQKRLRLQDWKIQAKFVSREDLPELIREGMVKMNFQRKEAAISIVEEQDRCKGVAGNKLSTEEILVHELLHIHVPDSFDSVCEQEASINSLTSAFLLTPS